MSARRFKHTCPLKPIALGNRRIYLWKDVEEWFTRWHAEHQNSPTPEQKGNWVEQAYAGAEHG